MTEQEKRDKIIQIITDFDLTPELQADKILSLFPDKEIVFPSDEKIRDLSIDNMHNLLSAPDQIFVQVASIVINKIKLLNNIKS